MTLPLVSQNKIKISNLGQILKLAHFEYVYRWDRPLSENANHRQPRNPLPQPLMRRLSKRKFILPSPNVVLIEIHLSLIKTKNKLLLKQT